MISINCPYCDAILQSDIDEAYENSRSMGGWLYMFSSCIKCGNEMKIEMSPDSTCIVEAITEEEYFSESQMQEEIDYDEEDYQLSDEDFEYAREFGIDIGQHYERSIPKLESYEELVKKYNFRTNAIPYTELLNTLEWQNKRNSIINRDNNTCKHCEQGTEDHNKILHVHHTYYVRGELPWNYKDTALLTLCEQCHWDLHQKTVIKVYELHEGRLAPISYKTCDRCQGAGYFPEYNHVQGGVCFQCGGSPYSY